MITDACATPQPAYGLTLADGSCWQFSDVGEHSVIAGRLARIMSLEKQCQHRAAGIMFSMKRDRRDAWPFSDKPAPERRCYADIGLCLWRQQGHSDILWEITENHNDFMQFVIMQHALFPIYQHSISLGGLPMHAALAELNKKGVLLVGSSNTGKSTCSRRFPSYWRSVCDDETLIVYDTDAAYQVHPFPTWSDYIVKRGEPRWSVSDARPLCGIFFLEQGRQDKVTQMGQGEAAVRINQSAMEVCDKYRHLFTAEEKKNTVKQTFANACSLANTIPAFRLCFSRSGRFWQEIETILHEQEQSR